MKSEWRAGIGTILLWAAWLWMLDLALGYMAAATIGERMSVGLISFAMLLLAQAGLMHSVGGADFRARDLRGRPGD